MNHPSLPIRIKAVSDDGRALGCGACLHTPAGPVCRSSGGHSCAAPQLMGPPDELQRLVVALADSLGMADGQLDGTLVRSLKLMPGEVVLNLAVGPECSGATLADAAFQTLRRLMPDTDIYVTHAASQARQ